MKSRFLTNYTETSFLSTIQMNLRRCKSFDFSVSFIKKAGLVLLAKDIKAALERGAKGRIITSTYQNFTDVESLNFFMSLKSATYRVSWEFTCKTTKILLLYIFLGHNRNVVNTKFPYPIKRLEVIRRFNQKSMAFNQSLS